MANDFTFRISTAVFDEEYTPGDTTRLTTNFANLARGERRRENLRCALTMIDNRCNDLVRWDNPSGDRYAVELEIVTGWLRFAADGQDREFPLLEMLSVQILDRRTGVRHQGLVGNNYSSHIRDYDFSVLLPRLAADGAERTAPPGFGDLHGRLFQRFVGSSAYRERFPAPPVICISASTSRTYHRTENHHPILGVEYRQDAFSRTDEYFAKMGLEARFFMPPGSVAPFAFYFSGDLLGDHTNLQLAGTVATMETFQKIYRPEIYNANSAAAAVYRPSLERQDFSRTLVGYDREERNTLARLQGAYADEHLMRPYGDALAQWAARESAVAR